MWTYITFVFFLALLDTCFGNKWFPGRVRIVKIGDKHKVSKVHRFFFIPVILWAGGRADYGERSIIGATHSEDLCWGGFDDAIDTSYNSAKIIADTYSGRAGKRRRKEIKQILTTQQVVWDSQAPELPKTKNNDSILELVPLLIEAVNQKDSAREAVLIEQINNLR